MFWLLVTNSNIPLRPKSLQTSFPRVVSSSCPSRLTVVASLGRREA